MTVEEEPVLSVLVPTYNYAAYIRRAIDSVVEQGIPGIEIIVADDGSIDDTESVLQPLAESGVIRYLRQPNQGPSAARNLALANAKSRFLMFLDADDVLLPGCIATTMAFMQRHPEVGLFFTNYDIFDDTQVLTRSGVDTWKVFRSIPHREVEPSGWIFDESLTPYIVRHGAFMHTSGLTLRREVAEEIGPFRSGYSFAEDDEYYARAAYAATAGYVDRVLSRKRNHPKSLIHDAANTLRNSEHLLELSEIQRIYYRDDRALQSILDKKILTCAEEYAWGLIESARCAEARACIRSYLARYPLHGPFYKLLLKAMLLSRRRPARV